MIFFLLLDNQLKYWLVMEYADGGTLRTYLKENFDKLTWEKKFNFAYQLACAASFLHGEGIVHCDLVMLHIILFIICFKIIIKY